MAGAVERSGGINGVLPHRVLDVPVLGVVRDVLIELALQRDFLVLVELVLLIKTANSCSNTL